LLRFCLMLSFNNRLYVQQYLPEIFHIIVLVVSTGSSLVRSTVHGLLINVIHSLCTSLKLHERQTKALNRLLNEMNEPKFRLLFGINRGTSNAFTIATESNTLACENLELMPLSSLEAVTLFLLEAMSSGAATPGTLPLPIRQFYIGFFSFNFIKNNGTVELAATWRSRWVGLATSQAFHFNPALQPRAFVELGCLSRGEMDDDLVYQILAALRRALAYFNETDCNLICSIIMSLSSMVESCSVESKFLRHLFWLGIAIAQIGHIPLFIQSLTLVQTVLRNLSSKGYFVQESPNDFLMRSRKSLAEVVDQIDYSCGVSFPSDFAFAVSVTVLKGLRHPATKAITISTLMTFLDITSKFTHQRFFCRIIDEDTTLMNPPLPGYADRILLGYFSPLLPIADPTELKDIFWMVGVDPDNLEEQKTSFSSTSGDTVSRSVLSGTSKATYYKIIKHLSIPDPTSAVLLISLMVTMLENAEYESESLFLYNFLAEAASHFPDVLLFVYARLIFMTVSLFSVPNDALLTIL
jgi:hypothetical protein